MTAKVISISEARRLLPGLVRGAAGRGPVTIGARGHAAAVLIGAEEYARLEAQAARGAGTTSPWARLRLEPVGTMDDVEAELHALREERAAALRLLDGEPARAEAPRGKRRRAKEAAGKPKGRPAR
jgi:prevent-host-death family protein